MSVRIDTTLQTYLAAVTIPGDFFGLPDGDFEVALGSYTAPGTFQAPDDVSINSTVSVTLTGRLGAGRSFDPTAGTYYLWGRATDTPDETLTRGSTRITVVTDGGVPVGAAVRYVPQQATAPDHTVYEGWLDSSTSPPTLKGWDGSAWVAIGGGGGGAVSSVFTRTGAVVAASGDYAAFYDALGAAAAAQTAALASADAYTDGKITAEVTRANAAYDAAGAAATAQAAAIAASQPLDSDLTAIAALATTSYGRAFLVLADAAAARTALALGTAATQASSAFDASGAASAAQAAAIAAAATDATTKANAAQAASQPLDSDLTAIAALATTSFGRSFLALADAAAGRTLLGLGTSAVVDTGTTSGTIPLLSTGGVLPIARLATGTPTGAKFVRDDGTLAAPTAAGLPSNVRTLTANATLAANDLARVNATSGALTMTLPASPTAGQAVMVKKIDASANAVTISGGNIEGNTSLQLNAPMASVLLVFSTQWEIAGQIGGFSGGTALPLAPTITATAVGNAQVTVYFTDTGPLAASYTITSSPGGITATASTTAPLAVTGLTNGTAYTFTVTATNGTGSVTSSASAAVTPSSFVPSSVGTLTAWYDPAQITALADGAAIASLSDLTGGGFTALQATSTKKPTFRCSSTTVTLPNNQPVMQFFGAQSLATILTAPNVAQPTTIFVVASTTTSGVVEFIFDGGNARQTIHFDSDHFLDFYGGSTVIHSTVPMPLAVSSLCAQFNGASSFLRKGGTQIAAGNPGSANLTGITLGASSGGSSQYHTGLIGEVLVYHAALTVPQIQQVEAYILNKWGV